MGHMNEEQNKQDHVFLEKNTWYHKSRVLKKDGKVSYGKKGGFESKEEAEKSFNMCEQAFRLAKLKEVYLSSNSSEMFFKDYLEYWMYEIYFKRIKDSTKNLTKHVLENWVYVFLDNDVKMKYLSTEFLDELLKRASSLTSSAANTVRTVLFIALNDAVADGVIKRNPMEFTKKYPRNKTRVRILTKKQLKKFLTEAQKSNWYLEILLGLFCGLRKGEILGLKFSDIDMETGILYVRRQLNYTKVEDTEGGHYVSIEAEPKTDNSYRAMKLPKVIQEELCKRKVYRDEEKLKYTLEDYEEHDYVSCCGNGKARGYTSLNKVIKQLCQKSGLPLISVHSLRHMYATLLLEEGVSLAVISALLGHSSIQTTFGYYCEIMEGDKQIIDYINEHFPATGE